MNQYTKNLIAFYLWISCAMCNIENIKIMNGWYQKYIIENLVAEKKGLKNKTRSHQNGSELKRIFDKSPYREKFKLKPL